VTQVFAISRGKVTRAKAVGKGDARFRPFAKLCGWRSRARSSQQARESAGGDPIVFGISNHVQCRHIFDDVSDPT
jgi:hypothetical protein